MKCPVCGKEVVADRMFCTWCEHYMPLPTAGLKAGVFRRWFASVIDPFLLFLAWFGPPAVLGAIGGRALGIPMALIGLVIVTVWFLKMYARGLTPGKYLAGEHVVDKLTGGNPGLAKMFVRETVGKFISGIFFGLGFFWAIWDKDNQAWHDKIAGTVVVRSGPSVATSIAPVGG